MKFELSLLSQSVKNGIINFFFFFFFFFFHMLLCALAWKIKSMLVSCSGGLSGSAAKVTSPNLVGSEPLLTKTSTLTVATESQHNLEHDQCELLPSPIIKYEEPANESTVNIFTQCLMHVFLFQTNS
jgi:hypothetical protein